MMTTFTYRASVALAALALLCPTVALSQTERNEISQGTSERVTTDRPTTTDRSRVGDRRAGDNDYDYHRPGEYYVGGFGGYTLGHSFSNIQGTGNAGQYIGDISTNLANSGVYGLKVGYFMPGRLNWLGFEVEGFHTTPHIKQSGMGPGGYLQVTTLAFNAIARGKYGCTTDQVADGRARTVGTGRTEYRQLCRLQPYVGIGLGLFFAELDGGLANNRAIRDNAVPGFNGLAGVRYFFTEHVALFGEYKYTRASFKFDDVAPGAGLRGDWHASHFVGGVSLHF